MIKTFMERASTKTGLQTFVAINQQIYNPGKKVAKNFKANMKIVFDEYLPLLNYTAIPAGKKISPFYSLACIRDDIAKTKATLQRTTTVLQQDFIGFE